MIRRLKNETVRDENHRVKFLFYMKYFVSFGKYFQSMFLCQIYSEMEILMAYRCYNFILFKFLTLLILHIKLG